MCSPSFCAAITLKLIPQDMCCDRLDERCVENEQDQMSVA